MPVAEALTLLKSERGEHFDPGLLDLFVENFPEIKAVNQTIADEPE